MIQTMICPTTMGTTAIMNSNERLYLCDRRFLSKQEGGITIKRLLWNLTSELVRRRSFIYVDDVNDTNALIILTASSY